MVQIVKEFIKKQGTRNSLTSRLTLAENPFSGLQGAVEAHNLFVRNYRNSEEMRKNPACENMYNQVELIMQMFHESGKILKRAYIDEQEFDEIKLAWADVMYNASARMLEEKFSTALKEYFKAHDERARGARALDLECRSFDAETGMYGHRKLGHKEQDKANDIASLILAAEMDKEGYHKVMEYIHYLKSSLTEVHLGKPQICYDRTLIRKLSQELCSKIGKYRSQMESI